MIHFLKVTAASESQLSSTELCRVTLEAIYGELNRQGVHNSGEDPRTSEEADMWTAVTKLSPEGSGLLIMSVWDQATPPTAMFVLRDDVLTDVSYQAVMYTAERALKTRYLVETVVAVNQEDDIAAYWVGDEVIVTQPPSRQEVRSRKPVDVRPSGWTSALWIGTSAENTDNVAAQAIDILNTALAQKHTVKVDTESGTPQPKEGGWWVVYDFDPPLVGRAEVFVNNTDDPHVWIYFYEGIPGAFGLHAALQAIRDAFEECNYEVGLYIV